MTDQALRCAYLMIICFSTLSGFYKRKELDKATTIIIAILSLTLCSEGLCAYLDYNHINKQIVFHVFSILELMLISFYFSASVLTGSKRIMYAIIGIVLPTLAILNACLLQPIHTLNSNIITLECFLGIAMALFAFYKFLIDDAIKKITHYIHFWIWVVYFIYFSGTFCFWSFIKFLYHTNAHYFEIASLYLHIANFTYYLSFGIIFLLSHQLDKKADTGR